MRTRAACLPDPAVKRVSLACLYDWNCNRPEKPDMYFRFFPKGTAQDKVLNGPRSAAEKGIGEKAWDGIDDPEGSPGNEGRWPLGEGKELGVPLGGGFAGGKRS